MMPGPVWENAEGGLQRIVVPGGWIYRSYETGAMCFVPHPSLLQGGRSLPVRPAYALPDDVTRKSA